MANVNGECADRLQRIGEGVLRWSLVFLLVFFGALKWTVAEAQGVAPFISNSPFLSWIGHALGQQGASNKSGAVASPPTCSRRCNQRNTESPAKAAPRTSSASTLERWLRA